MTSEEMIRRARERLGQESKGSHPEGAPSDAEPGHHESSADDVPLQATERADYYSEHLSDAALERSEQVDEPIFEEVDERPAGLPPFDGSAIDTRSKSGSARFRGFRRFPIMWVIWGLIAFGGLIYGYFTEARRDDSGAIVEAGELAADQITVGDCVMLPDQSGDGEFESMDAVPCSEPHQAVVYHETTYAGSSYPGEEALAEFAVNQCVEAFGGFTGVPYEEEARFEFSYATPTAASWSDGSRDIECFLENQSGAMLVGSQRYEGLLNNWGLDVASCYDVVEGAGYWGYVLADCADPHRLEAFLVEDLPGGETDSYPGAEVIDTMAAERCASAYAAYVGRMWSPGANPDYFWSAPLHESWQLGDRKLICLLGHPSGADVEGSFSTGA